MKDKEKRATELTEFEIERLRSELHQYLGREADIGAKGSKAVRALQDKLDAKVATHGRTKAELKKLNEEGTKKERTITVLRKAAQEKPEMSKYASISR